jgi:hypothetical protein
MLVLSAIDSLQKLNVALGYLLLLLERISFSAIIKGEIEQAINNRISKILI